EKRQAVITKAVTKGIDRDASMKDSGVEWIGEIPEGWQSAKLKFVSKFLNGYSFSSDDYLENKEGVPLIRIGDVGQKIDFNEVERVPSDYAKTKSSFLLNKNDILIALTGATIGKTSVYGSDKSALLNQRVGVVRATGVDKKYLAYFINSDYVKKYIELQAYGGAQENIGKQDIGNIYVTAPESKKEQQKIANYLDEKTSSIYNAINQIKEQNKKLKEYKKTLISRVVTGKIKIT
ncbi:MAG: restriction endonuclease subunit S, partial [Candidatus Paceibacteria bacterium]